jgi:hypothetical protein
MPVILAPSASDILHSPRAISKPPSAAGCASSAPGHVTLEGGVGDEVLVDPALVGDVREQRVEQGQVGAGLDRQVQHVLLARFYVAGIDRHRVARVDDDHLRTVSDAGNHVVEEQVRLRLQRIGADQEDGVGSP